MISLGNIPTTRLLVECEACRRCGAYRLQRLIEQRGAFFPLSGFLAEMRTTCGRQPCEALLVVPLVLDSDRLPMESKLFSVDTWIGEYQHEMQVADRMTNASATSCAVMLACIDQPTTRRENRSITAAK